MDYFGTQFNLDTIGQIITIFVIADSLLSLAITQTMGRQAMTRWRSTLWWILLVLWISVFLPLIELSIDKPPYALTIEGWLTIYNPLTKLAILTWFASIIILLIVAYRIFTLDLIKFNKSKLLEAEESKLKIFKRQQGSVTYKAFQYNEPKKWGIYSINEILKKEDKRIYFPIIISGDEFARPWEILVRFIVSGLTYGPNKPGAIYFTFSRPAFEIFEGLKRYEERLKEENDRNSDHKIIGDRKVDWKDIVIIDCYTQFAKRYDDYIHSYMIIGGYYAKTKPGNIDYKVSYADSNNPHDMNKKYENALRLLKKNGCKNVRVVYDALSDFLTFTDQQLAAQYLRHNMGWEQRNDIESLYLFRSGTIDEKLGEYFLWLANGALNIQRVKSDKDNPKDYLLCEFRGVLREPTRFKIDFEYNFLPMVEDSQKSR